MSKTIFLFLVILSNTLLSQNFMQLCGKWKVENKNIFEVWEKVDSLTIKGYSYVKSEENITEHLVLRAKDGILVYEATVKNQNKGETIPFILKDYSSSYLLFENAEHDFPQKIKYFFQDKDNIKITLTGNGKIIKYKLIKVY